MNIKENPFAVILLQSSKHFIFINLRLTYLKLVGFESDEICAWFHLTLMLFNVFNCIIPVFLVTIWWDFLRWIKLYQILEYYMVKREIVLNDKLFNIFTNYSKIS